MRRTRPARDLRTAIDCLPLTTRKAMLSGVESNRIIVGAYTDRSGGVCPMLAAHRNGGRTNFGTFARAWDAFTGANQRKPRRASRREVRTLEGYLEISLLRDGPAGAEPIPERPLTEEVQDVKATRRRLAAAEAQETADLPFEDVLATAYSEHAVDQGDRASDSAETRSADFHPDEAEINRSDP